MKVLKCLILAPKGEKKSASPKKKGGKKKNPWSDSEGSDDNISDVSDNDMDGSFMENFIPRERGPRRQAGRSHLHLNKSLLLVENIYALIVTARRCFLLAHLSESTVELQWLEHLWDYENLFETGVVRANEG